MISPEMYIPEGLPNASWVLKRDDIVLGMVQRFERGLDQTKVLSKSLGGTVYIQTIGSPTKFANIQLGCTLKQRDLVNQAEADGAYLSLTYLDNDKRQMIYYGYIEAAPQWTTVYPGEYYTCTLKFIYDI